MKREKIREIIEKYIIQAQAGNFEENEKFDFKASWYNLKAEEGLYEFLKDVSAIVNTIGPDGFIVIGYDEKKGTLRNTTFEESGLKDTNELVGIINKRVNRAFRIDYISCELQGVNIGILHIPPSLDKPHVLKNYKYFKKGVQTKEEEHRIFVRKGTTTRIANKYDLDLMNYDKKNIQPEYRVFSSLNYLNIYNLQGRTNADVLIVIENIGTRPMAISEVQLSLNFNLEWRQNLEFKNASLTREPLKSSSKIYLKNKNIIVKSNDIVEKWINYKFEEEMEKGGIAEIMGEMHKSLELSLIITLNNGKVISSNPTNNINKKQ